MLILLIEGAVVPRLFHLATSLGACVKIIDWAWQARSDTLEGGSHACQTI